MIHYFLFSAKSNAQLFGGNISTILFVSFYCLGRGGEEWFTTENQRLPQTGKKTKSVQPKHYTSKIAQVYTSLYAHFT